MLTGTAATTAVVDLVATAIASMEAISGITPVGLIAHPTCRRDDSEARRCDVGDVRGGPARQGTADAARRPRLLHPGDCCRDRVARQWSGRDVYRREQVSVEVGFNATDWATNTKTARAEERVGVAVTRPSSLYKLTLT